MLARQERWIMVRLLRSTQAALRAFIAMQETNYCRGTGPVIRGITEGKVSLDAAITELLRRDEAHRERSKRASRKKAKPEKSVIE